MSNKDSLGDRMKTYESAFRTHLPIRIPVIMRIDGKAFHSYTKGCKRPFDKDLIEVMDDTAKALCKEVQGCQLAYVQSDEISLLLVNYEDIDSQSWFDNNLQKMVSITASVASVTFTTNSWKIWGLEQDEEVFGATHHIIKPAFFDSRAWVLPKEEVTNYFLWRQQDCTRNSVQMVARSLYSHKECTDKNNSQLQEMIFQKGLNWDKFPTSQKRGRVIVKQLSNKLAHNPKTGEVTNSIRSEWVVDNEIPIFSADRYYIDKFVYPGEEPPLSQEARKEIWDDLIARQGNSDIDDCTT
jgi:tRNA(His) guanylyltransferase